MLLYDLKASTQNYIEKIGQLNKLKSFLEMKWETFSGCHKESPVYGCDYDEKLKALDLRERQKETDYLQWKQGLMENIKKIDALLAEKNDALATALDTQE